MASVTNTLTAYPSGYDTSNYSYASVNSSYPLSNAVGASVSSTTYAQWNLKTGSSAESYVFYTFDCSSIPENATINSVSCSAKAYINTTTSSRINTRQIQMYYGTSTAKGSATTVSTSTSALTLTCGSWTREELNDCRIRIYSKRGTSSTSSTYYNRFYGATLTISYTYEDITYTVTSSAINGTITPSGESSVSKGESITFVMEGQDNKPFKSLTANGAQVQVSEVVNKTLANGICLYTFDSDIKDELNLTTFTNSGGSVSSAQTKFNNSLYLNGSSYLAIALDQTYSDNTTIEFWFYTTKSNTSGSYPTLFSTNTSNASGGTYVHVDDGSYSTYPVYRCNTTSSGNIGSYGSTAITRSVWHHLAYCRSGSSHYYFLDGNLEATVTQASANDIETIYIGGLWTGSGLNSGCYFTGYIDELLVSNTCKWTSSFTVPTSAYTVTETATGKYSYTLENVQQDYTIIATFGSSEKLYLKQNGAWNETNVVKVYKKVNDVWVEQNDIKNVFDSNIKYKQGGHNLFAFAIDDTTYFAESGMTWGEWIESSYNTDGYELIAGRGNFLGKIIDINTRILITDQTHSEIIMIVQEIDSSKSYSIYTITREDGFWEVLFGDN